MNKILVPIALMLIIAATSTVAQNRPRITPQAAQVMQGSTTAVSKYWLFFDSSAISDEPVKLTDRARTRRAKVDPDNLLLDARDYPVRQNVIEQLAATGVTVNYISRWLHAASVEATPMQIQQAMQVTPIRLIDIVPQYSASRPPEPDRSEFRAPDATAVDLNYGPSLMQNQFVRSEKLHKADFTGAGVLIAMFDSGFRTEHEAFDSTTILATWDFINGDPDVSGAECIDNPQEGHGTLTFGAVGGYVPGTLIGVAFGADYILAKTEITCGGTEIKVEEDNWIAAAEWADSIGADIISASLGYNTFQDSGSYTLSDLDGNTARITIAADIAAAKNILVVNSAGNERNNPAWPRIMMPADGDSVLAIGAVREDGVLTGFSSPGPTADGRIKPDVVTLGQGVYTASSSGGYAYASGTSLSCPLAAGAAALAFDFDPTMTAEEYRNLARATADLSRIGGQRAPDNNYGYGILDAAEAADIIRFTIGDTIFIDTTAALSILVSTNGRAAETPALSAFSLPPGVTLVDSGNGEGSLEIASLSGGFEQDSIGLVATISYFVDTAFVVLSAQPAGPIHADILAYPNPFTDVVTIVRSSNSGGLVSVTIFNSAGEKVWERVNNSSGLSDTTRIEWDGRNDSGEPVAPGVYLAYVQSDGATELVKLLKVE